MLVTVTRGQTLDFDIVLIGNRFGELLERVSGRPSRSMLTEVFSVHERALNLRLADAESSDHLLSLVADRSSCTRNSLVISPGGKPLEAGGLGHGDLATLTVDQLAPRLEVTLAVAARERADRTVLWLTGAVGETTAGTSLYSGRVDPLLSQAPEATHERALLLTLAELILEHEDGTGFGSLARYVLPFAARGHQLANPFVSHAATLLQPAFESATPLSDLLPSLVGLGIGFTPSGDDFVAGALAAFALTGRKLPRRSRDALLARASTATTIPGAVLLNDAADESFPLYLREFAHWFAKAATGAPASWAPQPSPTGPTLGEAVERAARHGHSSGIDALTGFLLALAFTQT